jgi:hypothetical protein
MYAETGAKIFDAAGFNKIAAQIEAAGCLSATDPLQCYREAVQAGMVAPPTDTAHRDTETKRRVRNRVSVRSDL